MPRRERTAPALTATLLLAVVLLAFLLLMLPRLLERGPVSAGTPVPFGERAETQLAVRPGGRVCESAVTIDTAVGRATIAARPSGSATLPPLLLTLTGPDYREHVRLPAGGSGMAQLSGPISGPTRAIVGTACVRNLGARPIALLATGDPRVLLRTRAKADSGEQASAFALTFEEARTSSPLANLSELIDRAATFSAAGSWLYWLLLPLIVLGVPLAVATALMLALRSPDGPEPDDR